MMIVVLAGGILGFLALMVADFISWQILLKEREWLENMLLTLKEREVKGSVEDNKDGAVNGRVDGGESENQERL